MIKLTDIEKLEGVRKVIRGDADSFTRIISSSSGVTEGDLFVAVKGTRVDGHDFIPEAINRGASGIVCEQLTEGTRESLTTILVSDTASMLGALASLWYAHPTRQLRVTGITGTNGKTTIATSLYHLFNMYGLKSGLISTTGIYVGDETFPTQHTTPDALILQKYFSLMVEKGIEYVFMEVSSHAASQKRISGIQFSGGVFTNLSQDHLDYHRDLKAYLYAKKQFFDQLTAPAFALINIDDRHAQVMVQNTTAKVKTYAIKNIADYKPSVIEKRMDGTLIRFDQKEIWLPFPGEFSVYNLTAVFAVAGLLGMDPDDAWKGITRLPQVPGRFEVFRSADGKFAVVDYAHTPDALASVLKTIRQVKEPATKIWTVVGAGGNRDRSKRPRMARFAFDLSDQLILTSDNPRDEDPEQIIREMMDGLQPGEQQGVICNSNRAEAIKMALQISSPGDVVLIAGKGHETNQEIKGVRHHFDDREFVRNYVETIKH